MRNSLIVLLACLSLVACGRNNAPGPQGISDSGTYQLTGANSTPAIGTTGAFVQYTGMTGRLSLTADTWSKRIVYRGYSATSGGKFSSTALNTVLGSFTMYSSNSQYITRSGSYQIGTSSALTLQYAPDGSGASLTESWVRN